MKTTHVAPLAWRGLTVLVLALIALAVPAGASAAERVADPSAGWHGRAVQDPQPLEKLARTRWPEGWSAGSVGFGTGYVREGGSRRVRQVQRHLRQLGYRPGPVDGLFGPRTRAATRWFQYKHGLERSGRVNRSTLTVLQARAEHRPVPLAEPASQGGATETAPQGTAPEAVPSPSVTTTPTTGDAPGWGPIALAALLILVALAIGVLVGSLAPDLLPRHRRREAEVLTPAAPPELPAASADEPPAAPAPSKRTPVIGYAMVDGERELTDTAVATIALRCARRGWSLVEVIRDTRTPGGRVADRPGLAYALHALRGGDAEGLVIAHLADFTARVADLATLLQWLDEADVFLDVVDHPLDTSTRLGRATANAVIELGGWERQRITRRTREDLASGRFTPQPRINADDLVPQIAAMHERGFSLRAITNALNLAGVPSPPGHLRWKTTDVKAAAEGRHRT